MVSTLCLWSLSFRGQLSLYDSVGFLVSCVFFSIVWFLVRDYLSWYSFWFPFLEGILFFGLGFQRICFTCDSLCYLTCGRGWWSPVWFLDGQCIMLSLSRTRSRSCQWRFVGLLFCCLRGCYLREFSWLVVLGFVIQSWRPAMIYSRGVSMSSFEVSVVVWASVFGLL